MNFEVPSGGSGSAGFTNTGLGYDGSNLLIGDFTNGRIVKTSLTGSYVGEIVLASSPANSVQGVTFDTSDSTYWVCHYALTGGSLRHYNSSGTLLDTIDLSGSGLEGPNGCVYDAANDRVLVALGATIKGYSCATLSTTPVEDIIPSGLSSGNPDGVTLDPTDPATRLWVTSEGAHASKSYLHKINRSTGASVASVVMPACPEGIMFVGTNLYCCNDQGFHLSVPNGNRVWKRNADTGVELDIATASSVSLVAATTTVGTQIITGAGGAPKAAIVFGALTSNGVTSLSVVGVVDWQMRQWSESERNNDASDPTASDRHWSSTKWHDTLDSSGASATPSEVVSVTHDGLVLVNTTSAGRGIYVLFLHGADIDAYVGTASLTTGAGTVAVSGLPFQPKAVLAGMNYDNTTPGAAVGSRMGLGVMTDAAQWCVTEYGVDAAATSDEQGLAQTTAVLLRIQNDLSISGRASRSSLDATGFTLTKDTPPGANIVFGYLALGGRAQYACGALTQPNATTGNQAITGVGFTPLGTLFASAGRVANASATAHSRFMVGAAVSSSSRAVYCGAAEDAAAAANSARALSAAACLEAITDGGTPTVLSLADFVSNDADGFTVNWTTCDAVQRQNFYLAVGAARPFVAQRCINQAVQRASNW